MRAPPWLDELPLRPGPPWHALGTHREPAARWSRDPDQLEEKRRLLASAHDTVVVRRAGFAAAEQEVARLVAGADRDGALEDAALAVAEDLCVLAPDGSGRWRLVAGVVCFPSRWRPADKLGRSVAEIHDPVPAYAEELAVRVDRFLDALRPGRGAWRRNWFVHDDPALHQPEAAPGRPGPTKVPEGLWLRSERQSLHALPESGAVLFTIRTEQVPLIAVAERPDVAAAMAAALRSWSPDLVAYRGGSSWHDEVVVWLDRSRP
ncbi:MAG TPA: DUF3445 domain-containing protein [Acidimicrobiales bacterium]|nr:DUF3445 domain-containing protein [Acidimicrobiales bacterium]